MAKTIVKVFKEGKEKVFSHKYEEIFRTKKPVTVVETKRGPYFNYHVVHDKKRTYFYFDPDKIDLVKG